MVNDPIADMLIQLKNASMAGNRMVELPTSKMKKNVAQILKSNKYISSVEEVGVAPQKKLRIVLAYIGKQSVINGVKRVSKPGLRVYAGKSKIPQVMGGIGIIILSTPQGICTGKEAKQKGIGGEVLCEVW